MRELDPEIHDRQGLKPFTVGVGGREQAWLRFTFLDENVYAALSPALYGLAGEALRLGETRCRVKAVLQEDHPWAGLTTWPRLFQGEAGPDAPLRFATPTFFRRKGANYPLPEPRLVFSSLGARWNAFAPVKLPPELLEALTERTTLRHLNLHSKTTDAHERTVGFMGRATFHLPRASEEEARWLSALARFSFYSGVGAKTTLGFGQTKPYRLAGPEEGEQD